MPSQDDIHCTFTPIVCSYPPSERQSRCEHRADGMRPASAAAAVHRSPRLVVNENLLLWNIVQAGKRQAKEALYSKVTPQAGDPLEFGARRYFDE